MIMLFNTKICLTAKRIYKAKFRLLSYMAAKKSILRVASALWEKNLMFDFSWIKLWCADKKFAKLNDSRHER